MPTAEPTIPVDRVSEILRSADPDAAKLAALQALVDEALGPPPLAAPVERDPSGWPRLHSAQAVDTGTSFYFPPPTYDPRD